MRFEHPQKRVSTRLHVKSGMTVGTHKGQRVISEKKNIRRGDRDKNKKKGSKTLSTAS